MNTGQNILAFILNETHEYIETADNILKAPSDWPTLAEYCIVQPRSAAELGPPQASETKISRSGPPVATAEPQSSSLYSII